MDRIYEKFDRDARLEIQRPSYGRGLRETRVSSRSRRVKFENAPIVELGATDINAIASKASRSTKAFARYREQTLFLRQRETYVIRKNFKFFQFLF